MISEPWEILNKELCRYGIKIIGGGKCQFYDVEGKLYVHKISGLANRIQKAINHNIFLFSFLWKKIDKIITSDVENEQKCYDIKLNQIFTFSLQDLHKLLFCFEEYKNTNISSHLLTALNKDINSFSLEQIKQIPSLKMCIDWVHRLIHRLIYVKKLLLVAEKGKEKSSQYIVKMARGTSGPWSNLDLPMAERFYPYEGDELRGRARDKRNQRRYKQGLDNYNGDGRVSEGHYWREVRNEPFSWYDLEENSPYPHRNTLMYWG